jgi:hypothetical protein
MNTLSKHKRWWHGCSSDQLKQYATSTRRPKTLLATEVIDLPSTPPSTTVATPAKFVAARRHQNKHREKVIDV